MSSGAGVPPDALKEKYYKCHPKVKCSTVVCQICENVYHSSDFDRLNNGIFLSNVLVICPEHVDELNLNIKSKNVLSESAKIIIARLKLNQREELKKEILREISNNDVHPESECYENSNESEKIKMENKLLKQLNAELEEKNGLLKELLEKEKNNKINISNKTYANAVLSNIKPAQKRIPKIIVKKTNKQGKISTKDFVMHYLNKEKNIQTKKINYKSEDDIIIDCMDDESVTLAENILKNKAQNNFKVQREQLMNPKIKIVGIEMYNKQKIEELEEDIIKRNFKNEKQASNSFKILHVYSNTRNKTESALVEVTPEIYKKIKENNDKIFVGHQRCKVFDVINVRPCIKCGRFGHSPKKCLNEIKCTNCAGNHEAKACVSTMSKCANCIYSNEKYKTKLEVNHSACDGDTCTIFKSKIKKYIEMTDYPIKPSLPSYVGRTGTYLRTTTV